MTYHFTTPSYSNHSFHPLVNDLLCRQEAVRQSSESVQQENVELNGTVQNLVRKQETMTQELIAVTEERDKLADANDILQKEKVELSKAAAAIQDEVNV